MFKKFYIFNIKENNIIYSMITSKPEEATGEIYGTFWAISADTKPVPPGMKLMCATNLTDFPYRTIIINQIYDPWDYLDSHETCAENFYVWLNPTPNTTPLYFYIHEKGLFITFDELKDRRKKANVEPADSPIYVLTEKPYKTSVRVSSIGNNEWFKIKNDIPDFKFSIQNGYCIPNPKGEETLNDCLKYIYTNQIKPKSLKEKLLEKNNKKKEISISISNNTIYFVLFLFIFFMIFFIYIEYKKED